MMNIINQSRFYQLVDIHDLNLNVNLVQNNFEQKKSLDRILDKLQYNQWPIRVTE